MALNRHFPGHFARFVIGNSAISGGGLSLGENDLGEESWPSRARHRGGALQWLV
jgi:hypothetical protein